MSSTVQDSVSEIIAQVEQPTRTLQLETGDNYNVSFDMDIKTEDGGWCTRHVTVTDPTVDLNDLCRRIAEREFFVTEISEPEGTIIYEDGGRRYVVGHWTTWDESLDLQVDISFYFGDGKDRVEVDSDQLEQFDIQRRPEPDIDHYGLPIP